MNDIGTVAWAQRTGGRLTPAQAIGYTLGQLDHQRRRLRARPRAASPPASPAAPFVVPDTELTADIRRYASERIPSPILNHSWRVWTWANYLLPTEHGVNSTLLLAACLLHDAGLSVSTGRGHRRDCFTLRSADLAAQILERAGTDTDDTLMVRAAIIGHMNLAPPPGADQLTTVLHAATHLDVVGAQAQRLPQRLLAATHAEFPRDGFTTCFSHSFRSELISAPFTRAGLSWAVGLPIALRLNPIARTPKPDARRTDTQP
ncbi:HD domain-containing protein [Nocardia cyriacigeorgica]|uniref:HD domain-containing protein n=1 Tax=Nocardia cyriacigeorgica TaxID=135487 RepID=UPI0024558A49|nr:HD domain-containing protein [Nocardia cyriacigeorgica]